MSEVPSPLDLREGEALLDAWDKAMAPYLRKYSANLRDTFRMSAYKPPEHSLPLSPPTPPPTKSQPAEDVPFDKGDKGPQATPVDIRKAQKKKQKLKHQLP